MMSFVLGLLVAISEGSPLSPAVDLSPAYLVGQEVLYDGKVTEKREVAGTETETSYPFQVRTLVIEKNAKGFVEVSCCYSERSRESSSQDDELREVRFDLVRVDPLGRVSLGSNRAEMSPPLEEQATQEFGMFVSPPENPLKPGDKWVTRPNGHPVIRGQVLGFETVDGQRCATVELKQESQNWSAEQITTPSWSMTTKVWIEDKNKSVLQMERTLSWRRLGDEKPSITRQVTLRQATNVRYHGSILQNQIEEVRTALKAQETLEEALALKGPARRSKLSSVKFDLKSAMQRLYSTPYRPVIEFMHQRAEQVRFHQDSEVEQVVFQGEREAKIGQLAPKFTVRNVVNSETLNQRSFKGENVILVMLDPTSELSREALGSVMASVESGKAPVKVLAVCQPCEDSTAAELKRVLPGDYVVCSGSAMDKSYSVEGFPHVVMIDAMGMLRLNEPGFGPELASLLKTELGDAHRRLAAQPGKKSTLRR